MTNEDLKLEAIKKAYGEHWENVKTYVNQDGWIEGGKDREFPEPMFDPSIGELEEHEMHYLWRPKSLAGIENNRGWISMHSIHDLTIVKGQYYTIFHNGYIDVSNYDGTTECYKFWKLNFTHYQPIIKPELPLW